MLSAISADNLITVDNNRLNVLASAANINTLLELPKLIEVLQMRKLIDKSSGGVAVLGVTTAMTLEHTSDLFDSLEPSANEVAAISLAERASIAPILANEVACDLADMYKMAEAEVSQLFSEVEHIGFVDTEKLDSNKTLLFNGNLFRRDSTKKIKAVLDSLRQDEQLKLIELTETLKKRACISDDYGVMMEVSV